MSLNSTSPIPTRPIITQKGDLLDRLYQAWFGGIQQWLGPIGQYGPTAARPVNNLYIGLPYFDTTLGYPVFVAQVSPSIVWTAVGGGTVTSVASTTLTIGGTSAVPTVNLSGAQVTNIGLAGTALQPVTGLGGNYTYASLTLNTAGQITAVGNGTAPVSSANPSGTVGLAAVNGVASTYLRSDGAPALSQGIVPTWTGVHTFSAQAVFSASLLIPNATTLKFKNLAGSALGVLQMFSDNNVYFDSPVSGGSIFLRSNAGAATWTFGSNGALSCPGAVTATGGLGVNGASPPAQVTGFGTPTGASVIANFPGVSATLAQCSAAIAEILTIMKGMGAVGA